MVILVKVGVAVMGLNKHIQLRSLAIHSVHGGHLVEYFFGEGKQMIDAVDVSAPSLELFLGFQLSRFHVDQRVVNTGLKIKLLYRKITSRQSRHLHLSHNYKVAVRPIWLADGNM